MISRNKRFMAGLASLAAMGIALAGCGSSGDSTAGEDKGKSDGPVPSPICIACRIPTE